MRRAPRHGHGRRHQPGNPPVIILRSGIRLGFFSWEWVVRTTSTTSGTRPSNTSCSPSSPSSFGHADLAWHCPSYALRFRWTYCADHRGSPEFFTRFRAWPCLRSSSPLPGLSVLTAEIGLVSYTLLILIRNIVAGIDGVPAVDRAESARRYGVHQPGALAVSRTELPLALPVIIAGDSHRGGYDHRTRDRHRPDRARRGLGFFILRGLSLLFSPVGTTQIVVGVVLSVVLAIGVDLVLVGTQRALTPWARSKEAV